MIAPPRPPAHLGLRPLKIEWELATEELAFNILNWTGIKGTVYQMPLNAKSPLGYYKIITSESSSYFAKLIKVSELERQLLSNKITSWLAVNGVSVNCLLPGYPKSAESNFAVLLYSYIDGRFVAPTTNDFRALGSAIADMHLCLKHCPWSEDIKSQGIFFYNDLQRTLKQLKAHDHYFTGIPDGVMALIEKTEDDILEVLISSPQVVHGDLNVGNVLFLGDGTPIFLDFENTYKSWFSPLMEVAFAIERFALSDDDNISLKLGRILYQSYREKAQISFYSGTHLYNMLRALSVRALILLIHVTHYKLWDVPDSEWQKFISLYQQAICRKTLLDQIVHK